MAERTAALPEAAGNVKRKITQNILPLAYRTTGQTENIPFAPLFVYLLFTFFKHLIYETISTT